MLFNNITRDILKSGKINLDFLIFKTKAGIYILFAEN